MTILVQSTQIWELRCLASRDILKSRSWNNKWFCKRILDAACPAQYPVEASQLSTKDCKALKRRKHYGTTETKESEFPFQNSASKGNTADDPVTDPLLLPVDLQESSESTVVPKASIFIASRKMCRRELQVTAENCHLQLHQAEGAELSLHNRGQGATCSPCSLTLQQLQDMLRSSSGVRQQAAGVVVLLRE